MPMCLVAIQHHHGRPACLVCLPKQTRQIPLVTCHRAGFADSSSTQDLQPQHAAAAAPKQRTSLAVTTAAINFVDLAGSERAAHSADTGEAEKLRVKEVRALHALLASSHVVLCVLSEGKRSGERHRREAGRHRCMPAITPRTWLHIPDTSIYSAMPMLSAPPDSSCVTLVQAGSIHKSLLTLSCVIRGLADNQVSREIPSHAQSACCCAIPA